MEQSTKIFIAVGVLVLIGGGATAYAMSVPKKRGENDLSNPDGTNNANSIIALGNATNEQFEILAKIADKVGSDIFAGSSASQLSSMRTAFTQRLTYKEAQLLTSLLNKKSSDWSVDDRIQFASILKKWRGTPVTPNVTTPTDPKKTAPSVPAYDLLSDPDYDKKILFLDIWRNDLLSKQKKGLGGLFQKNIPAKNSFDKKFLPMSLADIKLYSGLQMTEKKNRTLKEETVMTNIRKKYPKVFTGVTQIYSFDGSTMEYPDLPNAEKINM